ncbi:acetyl-CoA hydrolase/transferase family protein [Bordetella holmesii]|uniref:Succinate CoA transferase n=2 Tax=Bordetella holmesii TaxID=35814 RepID=A0A158LZQ0_9BORD|nr:acetyl-CoA hydrolase/transferase family protein [Bordetella holmesii]AIT25464.1 putative coenzyme A transferase [Bordetella holmesii 44057]EWM41983.1 putative coenzyme A transferase [Bordetella holmesii 41130]AMD44648.1 acetyl-CoA hydrolase [Bordetella holmesii H558]AOB36748.1 acetyl-CoA hydrolase [Bordetella holmesii]AUL20710.1 propionyl-CoA--succinate CoA transferase [Bordetella holmesii]
MDLDRIRHAGLRSRVTTAQAAAELIQNGMTVGMSGFTRAGDCKAVPAALAERAGQFPLQITLITGASLGHDTDKRLADAGVLSRRLPFQVDSTLRRKINQGDVRFIDQHLSETVEQLRSGHIGPIDVAIIEAAAITEDGSIIPTMSVGNSASFAEQAAVVIVEINQSVPVEIEGLHDIYVPAAHGQRQPLPLIAADQRIGKSAIAVDPAKIAAIVFTDAPDSPSNALPADEETALIAGHIVRFLEGEVAAGLLTRSLFPLQAGIGTIANAVLQGFEQADFEGLTMYSEVLQDSAISLLDSGKLAFASASSITVSQPVYEKLLNNLDDYRDRLVLRPQEISNAPEIVRRLGLIAINTALEFDIYGNVNSTHVGGTHMMNGIGGSGDFARNAHLAIFVSKSVAKDGEVSSVVPMVPHVDHNEHDVDILVTECGLADLRGLSPRERAQAVIANCVHPTYRAALQDYYDRACERGGQTPHLLEEAFSWHQRYNESESMRLPEPANRRAA